LVRVVVGLVSLSHWRRPARDLDRALGSGRRAEDLSALTAAIASSTTVRPSARCAMDHSGVGRGSPAWDLQLSLIHRRWLARRRRHTRKQEDGVAPRRQNCGFAGVNKRFGKWWASDLINNIRRAGPIACAGRMGAGINEAPAWRRPGVRPDGKGVASLVVGWQSLAASEAASVPAEPAPTFRSLILALQTSTLWVGGGAGDHKRHAGLCKLPPSSLAHMWCA
jgi:hypothetical protein